MEEKKEFKLFRERSIESIDSPESLNDYLQVTSPGIWLVLVAVISILIGVIFWSIYGRINTTVTLAVISDGEKQTCLIPYDKMDDILSTGVIVVDEHIYSLQSDSDMETMIVSDTTNPYVRIKGNLEIGDVIVGIPITADLPEGVYTGTVITETLQPISLLIQ